MGSRVSLQGLKAKQYNGQHGTVQSWDDGQQRWSVVLDAQHAGDVEDNQLLIKAANLKLVHDDDNDELEQDIRKERQARVDAETQLAKLKLKTKEVVKRYREQQKQVRELENREVAISTKLQAAVAQAENLSALKEEYAELQSEVQQLRADAAQHASDVETRDEMKAERDDIQQTALRSALNAAAQRHAEELSQAQDQLFDSEARLESQNETIKALEVQLEEMHLKQDHLQDVSSTLNNVEVSRLEEENSVLKDKFREASDRYKQQKAKVSALENQLQQVATAKMNVEREFQRYSQAAMEGSQLEPQERVDEDSVTRIRELTAKNESLSEQVEDLQQKLKKVIQHFRILKKKHQSIVGGGAASP